MVRLAAVALAALVLGCAGPSGAGGPPAPSAVALPASPSVSPDNQPGWRVPPGAYEGERDRCIDAQLAERRLNEWGDPQGTLYPEGQTPLGVSASTRERYRHILLRHPEIGAACTRAPNEPER